MCLLCQLWWRRAAAVPITQEIQLAEDVHAPVEQGEFMGSVTVLVEGTPVSRYDLTAASGVERMTSSRA